MLTLFYAASTSFQSWRLRALHQKITRVIDQQHSLVFLKKSDGNDHGMATAFISSDVCINSADATVQECFWSNDFSQAISVSPKQILYVNPFITFPVAPSLIPFSYSKKNIPDSGRNDVFALIEADLNPNENLNASVLEIEAFAQMIAWKIDSKLFALVKTDSNHLSKLIFASFVHNHYVINDNLSLTRIQTVNVEGHAQDINDILNHTKKDIQFRSTELLSLVDWERHLEDIKSLGVLASQANEFEYMKNLTEGKTGIFVQPDIISSKTIEDSLKQKKVISPDTPKKSFISIGKTDEKLRELKQDLKKKKEATNAATSDALISSYDAKSVESIVSPESPKFPMTSSPAKSPSHSIKSKVSIESTTSPKFPIGSPAKKSFFNNTDLTATTFNEIHKGKAAKVIDTAKDIVDSVLKEVTAEEKPNVRSMERVEENLLSAREVRKTNVSDIKEATHSFMSNEQREWYDDKVIVSDEVKESNIETPVNDNDKVKEEEVKLDETKLENISEVKNLTEIKPEVKETIIEPTIEITPEVKSEAEIEKKEVIKESVFEKKEEPAKIEEKTPKVDQQKAEFVKVNEAKMTTAPEAPLTQKSKHSKAKRQNPLDAKPPNVLVYSDSTTTRSNVIKTLGGILKTNMYTIYPLTAQQVRDKIWLDNATLLVVCGSVNGSDVSKIFLEFFFKGGKILCLCSDLLRQVLPTYHTAEVREHELVQFSYGQWKNIKMMHHIFCYQPSPVRKHFSQDSDEPPKEKPNSNPLIVLPRSVELRDDAGVIHNAHVQILGTEDTWKTPSLLMVYSDKGGKIIFSQIHLEIDPSFYESDEQKYQILMKNDELRHEIFGDVLSTHLGLTAEDLKKKKQNGDLQFTKAFFLGRHESKFEILEQLKPKMDANNVLKIDGLSIKFCGKNETPPTPESYFLPVMVHSCPDDFSTLDYFDTLKTEYVGRLMIYSHALASSMNMVNKIKYSHGLAIVSRILTQANGRGNNQWLSPPGCLMFTLQLHIPLSSPLGQRISLIQHLIATAVVTGLKNIPGYSEALDLNVKWPNDIYANGDTKIGGLIVNSTIEDGQAICNIGLGVNLSNSIPTTCINDMIKEYNKSNFKDLKEFTYEKTLAVIFNEIENILNRIQSGDVNHLYDLYYSCWLHTDSSVKVLSSNGQEKNGKILGIDEYGFLKIRLDNNITESVQPDGNSFDMIRGLIIPKAH